MFQYRRLTQLIVLLCALVCLSACGTSQKKRDEAQLRLQLGTALLNQGNLPSALRELLNAERLDPKNEVVQNHLGIVYFLRKRYDLAEEHFKRALDLKPSYSEARNNYGSLLVELERHDEAIAHLKRVLDDLTYGNPSKAWVNIGRAHFRKGQFKEAKERFAEALKFKRENCLAQTLYGRSLLELKSTQEAATSLDNAVVICRAEKFEEPYYYSGLAYYKLGQTSKAIARMEEIIKHYPEGKYVGKAQSLLKVMK